MSDQDRVLRARGGDRDAFDELVRRHFAATYSLLFRLVGNHEDAEDLAQESFVRAYRALELYRGDAPFHAWVLRIAVHVARDHHRRRGAGPGLVSAPEPDLVAEPGDAGRGEPLAALSRRELVQRLAHAVEALPHPLRAALVLRVLEGRSYADVGRLTGLRPGTVRTQVMKARRALLHRLAPWLGEAGGEEGSP